MSLPYTFTNGTVADADEVNANFDYVEIGHFGGNNNGTSIAPNTTRYISPNGGTPNATEANQQIVMTGSGILRNFYINVNSNDVDATSIFTVRKNSTNTALTVSYEASATGSQNDITHSGVYIAGDKISIAGSMGATGGTGMNGISWGLDI